MIVILRAIRLLVLLPLALVVQRSYAQSAGVVVPPEQSWYVNDYLSCNLSGTTVLEQSPWPGDSPLDAMQRYVDAENQQCSGELGANLVATYSLNQCTPTIFVYGNGEGAAYAGAEAYGCTYNIHGTPVPGCSPAASCQPFDLTENTPAAYKVCVGSNEGHGNGSQFTLTAPPTYGECEVPAQYYVANIPLAAAQYGQTCNCVAEPINPANGVMYNTIVDSGATPNTIAFKHFYNSTDTGNTNLSNGWRHSYSRNVVVKYSTSEIQKYLQSPDYSSQYADPATACTSGFPQIQSRVTQWSGALASYVNGNCVLTKNGNNIGTLTVYSTGGALAPVPTPVAYDVVRDDGQLISFTIQNSNITAPPGINLRLQQTSTGFTITDANDNVEQYDTTGKLLTVTSRGGVVQTMTYDSSGNLSNVSDSFGHQLILNYNTQNQLSSVTRQ